jgi:fluoroacetyl-CoA thioesterase
MTAMKETLKPGIKYEHTFKLPRSKTVAALYPESEEFVAMPEVFATGFLVAPMPNQWFGGGLA